MRGTSTNTNEVQFLMGSLKLEQTGLSEYQIRFNS